MNTHVVHGALISTDASFRESVKQVLGGAQHGVELSVEIAIACTEISAAQVEELRRVTLDLVLLDLERDPVTGIKFAHFLEIGRATSELQSRLHLVCRLLLEKKKEIKIQIERHRT